MILPIVTTPNPVLLQPAKRIDAITPEISRLVADMRETMHNAQGLGLAAPQVNKSLALCILEYNDPDELDTIPFTVLINPRITWKSARQESEEEACLSIPGVGGIVKRPREVRVKAEDLDGNTIEIEAKGLFARALQHEIDHLNGVLFTSYVPKSKLLNRETPDYPRV
jgi:peptide deformylase